MASDVTYQQWLAKYTGELQDAGVNPEDARSAAHLGWYITFTDHACYGVGGAVPVHFSSEPNHSLEGVVAGCGGRRFGTDECYIVYAPQLAHRLDRLEAEFGGQVGRETLMAGIAAHEVRHRVQGREQGAIVFFDRARLSGIWFDEQAAHVALNMRDQFGEWEQKDRIAGVAQDTLARVYSDDEYDAAVIERLLLHRYHHLTTDSDLARLVRMSCPRID